MVPTRQRQDPLWELPKSKEGNTLPLDPTVQTRLETRLVEGYGRLRLLAVLDQPFTIEVYEAPSEDGPFVRTGLYPSAAATPASAGQFVSQQHIPTGPLAYLAVTNTGIVATGSQQLYGAGLPI